MSLNSADSTAEWAKQNGIEICRALARVSQLAGHRAQGQRLPSLHAGFAIKGTPSLVVDGRFLTSTGMSETVAGVIPILEDLIRLAREQRAKK